MKLSVSNIAWDAGEEASILKQLALAGVTGIEVAPTKIWPDWQDMTTATARRAAKEFADKGFAVPALQAILFGKPDLSLFGDDQVFQALSNHIAAVAEIAAAMNASVLVFGSPRNRDPGEIEHGAAWTLAVERFRQLAERCAQAGVILGLEANPSIYNCRFITRWRQALDMVKAVDHPALCVHLDAACTHLEGDDPADAVSDVLPYLAHVHATEPNLGTFASTEVPHIRFAQALYQAQYSGWISIEMRRADDPINAVGDAVTYVKQHYFAQQTAQ